MTKIGTKGKVPLRQNGLDDQDSFTKHWHERQDSFTKKFSTTIKILFEKIKTTGMIVSLQIWYSGQNPNAANMARRQTSPPPKC